MPDDSIACNLIMEQLRIINGRLETMSDDISELKNAKAISDGERGALAKLGAVAIGLCSVVGAGIAVLVNLPKWTGHQ